MEKMRRAVQGMGLALVMTGCGGGAVHTPSESMAMRVMPGERSLRDDAVREFGEYLFRLLRSGHPSQCLADDASLDGLVDEVTARRIREQRISTHARLAIQPSDFMSFNDTEFSGICLQGSRVAEQDWENLGLVGPAWLVDRALVVGTQPTGGRVASWLEGQFVYTNAGFRALTLRRIERPRWEHSDLEIATCDVELGLHGPLPVVEVTD